jgi:hypothetical protein
MTSMRLRAAFALGLAILIVAPVGALADAPPTATAANATGTATEPPDTAGQVVTIIVPAEATPPKKAATKTAKAATTAPTTPAHAAPVVRRRTVTHAVTRRTPVKPKSRPSVHGGASTRVAEPRARGAASTVVVAPPVRGVPPALAPAVASPAKPGDSTSWTVWLLAAIGALELLVVMRFAYRRWSRRRSLRRAARNVSQAAPVSAPKNPPSGGTRQLAKRWRH